MILACDIKRLRATVLPESVFGCVYLLVAAVLFCICAETAFAVTPANVQFTATSSNSVQISWSLDTPSDEYPLIVISLVSNFATVVSSFTSTVLGTQTTTFGIAHSIRDNTTYYFKVKVSTEGDANYSSSISTITSMTAPTNVIFDEVTSSTIVASAYASTFTNMGVGQTGIRIAKGGVYEAWHLGGESWTTKAAMLTGRHYLAAASLGSKIYAIGGDDGISTTRNDEYDPVANNWVTRAAMPTGRRDLAAVSFRDKIYAIGGWDGAVQKNQNEEYDPVANSWVTRAAMPTARDSLMGVASGSRIYAIGGWDGASAIGTNEAYDPVTNKWVSKTATGFTARFYSGAGAFGNKIYVIGGIDSGGDTAVNEAYDPAGDSWSTKVAMPTARDSLAAVFMGGKFHLIGGWDADATDRNYNEVFDPVTISWSTMTAMPTARHGIAAASVGEKIYVLGGVKDTVGGVGGVEFQATNEAYDPGVATQFAGLSPNTQYSFKAKARNSIGAETGETATISTYTAAVAPTTSLAASTFSSITAYTFTLNWSSGASSTGFNPAYTDYVAHLSTASDFTGTIISSNTKNFNASGFSLTPDTTYYARVKGNNVDGVDTWYTSFGSSMTSAAVETSPLYSTYTSVFSSSFTLQWDSGTSAGGYNHYGTRYVAEISTMSNFTPLWSSSSTLNIFSTFTSVNLQPNTTYYARVKGINAIGASSAYLDFGSTVTLTVAPVASTQYSTFTSVYASSFTVNWDSGTQAGGFNPSSTRYLAEISTKSNFTPLWYSSSTLNISAGFTGLTANTTYYARVKAVNHQNISTNYFDLVSTVTAIETPTDIIFDEITPSTITASAYASTFTNIGVGQTGIDIAKGGAYEAWHLNGSTWTTQATMPTARLYNFASASAGGKIYAIGGGVAGVASSKNEEYDPVANSWSTKAAMPTARDGLAAAAVLEKIYTVGGWAGVDASTKTEEYDPAANSWVTKASLPAGRTDLAVVNLGSKIYAIGGNAGGSESAKNEEFDPAANRWVTKAAMPTPRQGLAAASAQGKIYVIGGSGAVASGDENEEYAPGADSWVTKAPLPTVRETLAAASVGGKIYVIGGYTVVVSSMNEVFDPLLNSWITKEAMPTARQYLSAVVMGGKIYAVGGYTVAISSINEAYDPGVATQFTGLSPNTQYSFKAKARNAIGAETAETATISTYTAALAPTTPLAASTFSSITAYTFTLNWSSGASSTGFNPAYTDYEAHIATASDFTGTIISSKTKNLNASGFVLKPNTTYYARVKGINVDGVDTWYTSFGSSMTSAAVEASTQYSTFTSIFSSSFTVNWDSGTSAGGYNPAGTRYFAEISTMASFNPLWSSSSTLNLQAGFTGLSDNSTYYARVKGINAIGASSSYVDLTSTITVITTPTDIIFDDVFATTITASAYASTFTNIGIGQTGFRLAKGGAYEAWHLNGNSWTTKTAMPTARRMLAAATVGGKIYAIGGTNGTARNQNEEYDPILDNWSTKATLPTARAELTAASVGGKIYAIGGVSSKNENEEYDPVANSWVTRAAMPTGRHLLAATTIGSKIYVMGGDNGTSRNENEQYDPDTNTWTTKASLLTARDGLITIADGVKIYAIGGSNGTNRNQNEEYDPTLNNWTTKQAMTTARSGLTGVEIGKKVYVVGGFSGSASGKNEAYDPTADSWITKQDMPTARYSLAAASVGGKLYVIGGDNGGNLVQNEAYDPGVATEFSGLTPNTQYNFIVKARNSVGTETPETATISTYTLAAVAVPSAVATFTNGSTRTFTVNWASGTAGKGFNSSRTLFNNAPETSLSLMHSKKPKKPAFSSCSLICSGLIMDAMRPAIFPFFLARKNFTSACFKNGFFLEKCPACPVPQE